MLQANKHMLLHVMLSREQGTALRSKISFLFSAPLLTCSVKSSDFFAYKTVVTMLPHLQKNLLPHPAVLFMLNMLTTHAAICSIHNPLLQFTPLDTLFPLLFLCFPTRYTHLSPLPSQRAHYYSGNIAEENSTKSIIYYCIYGFSPFFFFLQKKICQTTHYPHTMLMLCCTTV